MKSDTTFAGRLKTLRKAAGLSVAALAKKVNVTVQYIYMIEKGERVPAWEVICELADTLSVSVEAFRGVK